MTIQIKRVANGYIAEIEGHEYVGTSVNDIMRVVMQQPIWDEGFELIRDKEGKSILLEINTKPLIDLDL